MARVPSFLAGVSAGLAALLIALLLRWIAGVPSPPELLVDPATLLLPAPLFAFTLSSLEYLAKPLLVAVLVVLEILLAGAGGVAYARLCHAFPRYSRGRGGAFVVLCVTSAGALFVFLPLVGVGLAGGRSTVGAAPYVLGTLLANGTYSLVLSANLQPESEIAATADDRTVTRRRRLVGQIGLGSVALLLGGRAVYRQLAQNIARNAHQLAPGMPPEVTPNDAFYVVTKNVSDPMVNPGLLHDPTIEAARWRLDVAGLVERPLTFTYDQLTALPAVEQYYTLCCISNPVGGKLIGTALWTGVPLTTILNLARPRPGVRKVVFQAADDYGDTVSWEIANRTANLLAWAMNGAPLPPEHGFPVRLLIPNHYGIKNVKWLTQITLVDEDVKGYWQQRGWSDAAIIQTLSRIDVPRPDARTSAGPGFLGGIAFAGSRGISRVEISVDDGKTWRPATVKPALSPFSWVLWSVRWEADPGPHALRVRATDGTGQLQRGEVRPPLPAGATGYDAVVVEVT